MDTRDWVKAALGGYIEYTAQWRPDGIDSEPAPVRFIGQYGCPLIVDGAVRGHYVKPLMIEAGAPFVSGSKWLAFTHPPAPRKYFQYPHLLECSAGAGSGRVVAGGTSSAHLLPELPRASGTYETRQNMQW